MAFNELLYKGIDLNLPYATTYDIIKMKYKELKRCLEFPSLTAHGDTTGKALGEIQTVVYFRN